MLKIKSNEITKTLLESKDAGIISQVSGSISGGSFNIYKTSSRLAYLIASFQASSTLVAGNKVNVCVIPEEWKPLSFCNGFPVRDGYVNIEKNDSITRLVYYPNTDIPSGRVVTFNVLYLI